MNFTLDYAGGGEVLKEVVADEIRALGERVGTLAGDEAEVEHYVTDRAAASVRVPVVQQARDGALTRAAAAAGLEVHPE